MSKPIIEIEHLSKCYRIGATREPYLSLRDELARKARRVSSVFSRIVSKDTIKPSNKEIDFWALNDVNFSVQEGEVVGIIGRNGAGKSTLLKILSQITPPTKGQITMRGRVASLLEVGTGFHPELTGRENIFLNGAILGMRRKEIRRKFDEIVAFAEVEKFLDTPVKRYSSGMYVRLAFAVAAHLEPEILIIDEVLAVGDAEFQKKCLGKMGEVAKQGRTVLFVSHNMQAVKLLCSRAILLDSGKCVCDSDTHDAINRYLNVGGPSENGERIWNDAETRPGDNHVRLHAARLRNEQGDVTDLFDSGKPVIVEFEVEIAIPDRELAIGFDLVKTDEVIVLRSFQNDVEGAVTLFAGHIVIQAVIPGELLNAGYYGVAPRISIFGKKWIVHTRPIIGFNVTFTHGKSSYMNFPDRWGNGLVAPVLHWRQCQCNAS